MKITSRKSKNKNLSAGVCWFAVFAVLPLMFGCEESGGSLSKPISQEKLPLKSQALSILEKSLADPSPGIRSNAVEAAANSNQKQLMGKVLMLLKDEYVHVRFAATLALGDSKYYPAKNTLMKLADDSDDHTKIGACYALYKLGYRKYLEPIREAAKSEDQTVRANAVMLLGKTGDRSTLELLYWAKDNDDSIPIVRYQAAEAIARLGDRRIMNKLWTLLISKFVENKIIGIRAMGALGTAQAKEVLLTKLNDDILEIRLIAAEQLGVLGDKSGMPVVHSVFEENLAEGLDMESNERVLALTAIAIGRIDSRELDKYLPKLMKSESKLVRLSSAQAVLQTIYP